MSESNPDNSSATDDGKPPELPILPPDAVPASRGFLIPSLVWRVLHWPLWLFCHFWIRVDVQGREHLSDSSGGVLLANHQSFLDPMLVAIKLRRPVAFLARDNLMTVPVLGWILRHAHVIPISREAARAGSIRTAMLRLEEGFLVGMFPEGTRTSGLTVNRFRPGFLAVIRRTNEPIYPVGIAGADRLLAKGSWFLRPGRVHVVFGPPLSPEDMAALHDASRDDAELCELVRVRVSDCVQQAAQLR